MDPNEVRADVTSEQIEIRCPVFQYRLLLKVARPRVIDGMNYLEVACRDCRNRARQGSPAVQWVLHRYNVLGEHIETDVVSRP